MKDNHIEDLIVATTKNIKDYINQFREELDKMEEDLDSDDEHKNIHACYYGIALGMCTKNIQTIVDELINNSKEFKKLN